MSNFSNSNTMSKFRFSGLYSNPRTITLDDDVLFDFGEGRIVRWGGNNFNFFEGANIKN
jgi:hypothetical protein